MAFPTAVNSQITDAVTQTNVKVLGDTPAISLSELYVATSQALSTAAQSAAAAQQQVEVTAQAATTMGVSTLYAVDTASTGNATELLFGATMLSGPGVSAAHIAAARNERPQLLYLGNTGVDASHIRELQAHAGLQVLHLDNVEITDEDMEALRAALPDTHILRVPPG